MNLVNCGTRTCPHRADLFFVLVLGRDFDARERELVLRHDPVGEVLQRRQPAPAVLPRVLQEPSVLPAGVGVGAHGLEPQVVPVEYAQLLARPHAPRGDIADRVRRGVADVRDVRRARVVEERACGGVGWGCVSRAVCVRAARGRTESERERHAPVAPVERVVVQQGVPPVRRVLWRREEQHGADVYCRARGDLARGCGMCGGVEW